MSDSPDDLMIGQLALARGFISLEQLLQGVQIMARQSSPLLDVLEREGVLDRDTVRELRAIPSDISSEFVSHELDHGQTIVVSQAAFTQPGLAPRGTFPTLDTGTFMDATELIEWELPLASHRYSLLERLGQGGMGEVWLARDNALEREVALKMINAERRDDLNIQLRLNLEARVTGKLEHPSIIPIYDLGELDSEGPYYAMRVVREMSLNDVMNQMRRGEECDYSLNQLVSILRMVLLALQYAHDQGVIHRDLKPENILIGAYGEVFIIDWGVAKIDPARFGGGSVELDVKEPTSNLVGTPMYMAPEQALGENHRVDARTDVYAMGAVLYEILCLKTLFEAEHLLAILFQVVQNEPPSPSERAPERVIPRELEEICMKALRKAPERRYQSAQEMARELELYLDGVKQQQHREEMVRELLTGAEELRTRYHQSRKAYVRALMEVSELETSVPSWAPLEEKEKIWRAEQRAEELLMETERAFGEATRAYSQALDYLPDTPAARRALAELYWQRFLVAEASGDQGNALYFEGLVRRYNDGQFNTLLAGVATLSVRTIPTDSLVKVYRYERGLHRLTLKLVEVARAPVVNMRLPHGPYLVTVEAPHHATIRMPLLLNRLDYADHHVQLFHESRVPEDMILIPGGPFLSGNIQPIDREKSIKHVPTFAIQRAPVTCQQYLEFLNDVARQDPEQAQRRAPRMKNQTESYFEWQDGQFSIPVEDAEGDAWDPRWPICMIDYEDACAYAAWRSARDLHTFRLPTALEWEKAARGVDGRLYPWGDEFDPAFCNMRESTRGRALPRPVGSFPDDCSPYGVMDMAGNIIEWTSTCEDVTGDGEERTMVLQGAAFNSIALLCRLDWSLQSPETFRYASYGFRLVMELDD